MQKNSENSSAELQALDRRHIWHPFSSLVSPLPIIPIVKGAGVWLSTEDGRKILDAVSSWWVNLHGHGRSEIANAIAAQAHTLEQVIFAGFTHSPAIRLAERLLPLLPGEQDLLFFSDNGSTSVEVALKMALQYWYNKRTDADKGAVNNRVRHRIIAIEGAYHGDTFGAMSVGERGGFNLPFEQHLFHVDFIPFPAEGKEAESLHVFNQLLEAGDVAAFIFEPLVQGSAGMRMYQPGVLQQLMQMAHAADVLCIADEVMTGFGRTGLLFACDHVTEGPDLVCLSKGITGGFMPLGVTACTAAVADAFRQPDPAKTFYHGHSYTANPLACAAALASLDLLLSTACVEQRQLIEAHHQEYAAKIKAHPAVGNVRVRGTILAVELYSAEGTSYFNSRRNSLYQYFLDKNILLRPLGNVVYILPPYVIGVEELKLIYAALDGLLETWLE